METEGLDRLFVVCGRAIEVEALQEAFQVYGSLQQIRVIKEKGVAFVTYSKASSAALAIECLHDAVLNNGQGPRLKVMLADAPNSRQSANQVTQPHLTSCDPDNLPPRSRLFLVVPKNADEQQIQLHMSKFQHLEACKTDMAASKGIVFCKFDRASAALTALEHINLTGLLAGYKVKCMLAKPKIKIRLDAASPTAAFQGGMPQVSKLGFSYSRGLASSPGPVAGRTASPGFFGPPSHVIDRFGATRSQSIPNPQILERLTHQVGLGFAGALNDSSAGSPVTPINTAYRSDEANSRQQQQRLFVVVHKGASEELIVRLFRRFPGMEYCDLKKDHVTGKSKGFCFVNYSTPTAAAAAIEQLHGSEFPPLSGHRIKVLYAEPLVMRHSGHSGSSMPLQISPSVQTPPPGIRDYMMGQGLMASPDASMNPNPARKLFDHMA